MKRISTQKNSFWKRLLINIPFVLMVALMVACFAGGAALLMYCVVTAIAFGSAMISVLLIGAGFILIGVGLALIMAFKKYYAFYDLKMGWVYPDRPAKREEPEKTATAAKKPIKAYFTLSNVSLAVLAIGSLFTVISAALGCINRDNWVSAIGPYKQSHGYYDDVHHETVSYYIEDVNTHGCALKNIDISLIDKQAVVIYTDIDDAEHLPGYIYIEDYTSYDREVICSYSSDKATVTVKQNPAPSTKQTAIDKMLFFVGDILHTIPSERQIFIYIPKNFDGIEIACEPSDSLIFAKENA